MHIDPELSIRKTTDKGVTKVVVSVTFVVIFTTISTVTFSVTLYGTDSVTVTFCMSSEQLPSEPRMVPTTESTAKIRRSAWMAFLRNQ